MRVPRVGSVSTLAVILVSTWGCGTSQPGPPDVVGKDAITAESEVENAGWAVAFVPNRDPRGCRVTRQRSTWSEVRLVVNCDDVDWNRHHGKGWNDFTAGFSRGFSDGCRRLFRHSVRSTLYDGQAKYTLSDCVRLKPRIARAADSRVAIPTRLPTDPSGEGYTRGMGLGCTALFDEEGIGTLSERPDGPAVERRDRTCAGGRTSTR
jgi:hypothetical protein